MSGLGRSLRWVAFVAVAASVTSFAVTSSAQGISGSLHDFSGAGWNPTTEICVVCHTPHTADTTVADAPLWNHEVTAAGPYTLYTSSTFDAAPGQPDGISKLCLSCHDGTVAVDAFGGAPGGTLMGAINPAADFGTDLSDDHPISFTYDAALAGTDGGLFDPTTALSGLGGTIDADMLFTAKVECASCHDVHDAGGNPSLLLIDNTGSALCLTCHDK